MAFANLIGTSWNGFYIYLAVYRLSLGNKHGGAILGEPPTIPVVPRQDEPEQEEEGFFASIFK